MELVNKQGHVDLAGVHSRGVIKTLAAGKLPANDTGY